MSHSGLSMWYHQLYTGGIHPDARFPRDRYIRVLERLTPFISKSEEPADLEASIRINNPKPIKREHLLLAHDAEYVDRFLAGSLTE